MIGLLVHPAERDAAREFFELFKTPWEFADPGKSYDIIISTDSQAASGARRLLLLFNGSRTDFEAKHGLPAQEIPAGALIRYNGRLFPIYHSLTAFPSSTTTLLSESATLAPVIVTKFVDGRLVLRIGYNPFHEAQFLLTQGQPPAHASVPTLDLHIAVLRDLITRAGLPVVEVPPVPQGHSFIGCLTHDVDHPVLRNHRFDHTMLGFITRASVGTLVECLRGKRPAKNLLANWVSLLKLPLIHLKLASDHWATFDRYLDLEQPLQSTFFVIPQKGYEGRQLGGKAPAKRACRYSLSDIRKQITRILAHGHEVGLHGIDAWLSADSATAETQQVAAITGQSTQGVRMHWLYFNADSHQTLDRAGFSYDSTVGYNQTVGYRAGTLQVFQPFGTRRLLELPLHVMDTALFYPNYLNLGDNEARLVVAGLFANAREFGGALTINWHDRSISPERLWADFYLSLLGELHSSHAWCPTAGQAVAWFRMRRDTEVAVSGYDNDHIAFRARSQNLPGLPSLQVRIHLPSRSGRPDALAENPSTGFRTFPLVQELAETVPLSS